MPHKKDSRLSARKTVLEKCGVWMRDYMKSYYSEDEEIHRAMLLKEAHTGRVLGIIRDLATHLGLGEEDVALAELIGLLHDVGRFRQFTVYRTFKDAISEDHAEAGLTVIRDNGLLEGFLPWEKSIVDFSVSRHNKKEIGPAPSAPALGFAKMIRDADKLDIYHVLEPYVQSEDGKGVSPDFVDKFVYGEQCDYTSVKTEDDKKLVRLMWVYDINFSWTLRHIKERGYIDAVIGCLPRDEKMDKGIERLFDYVKKKLGEEDDAGFLCSRECETGEM